MMHHHYYYYYHRSFSAFIIGTLLTVAGLNICVVQAMDSRQNSSSNLYRNLFGSGANSMASNNWTNVGGTGTVPTDQNNLNNNQTTPGYNYFVDPLDSVNPFAAPIADPTVASAQHQQQQSPSLAQIAAQQQQQVQSPQKPPSGSGKKKKASKQKSNIADAMANMQINPASSGHQMQHPVGGQSFQNVPMQPVGSQSFQNVPMQSVGSQSFQNVPMQSVGSQSFQNVPMQPVGSQSFQNVPMQPVGSQSFQNVPMQPVGSQSFQNVPMQPVGSQSFQGLPVQQQQQQQQLQHQLSMMQQQMPSIAQAVGNSSGNKYGISGGPTAAGGGFASPIRNNSMNSNANMMTAQAGAGLPHSTSNISAQLPAMAHPAGSNSGYFGMTPQQGQPGAAAGVHANQADISGQQLDAYFMQEQQRMMSVGNQSQRVIQYTNQAPMLLPTDSFIAGGTNMPPAHSQQQEKLLRKQKTKSGAMGASPSMRQGSSLSRTNTGRKPMDMHGTGIPQESSKTPQTRQPSTRRPLDFRNSSSNLSAVPQNYGHPLALPAPPQLQTHRKPMNLGGQQNYAFNIPALQYNVSNVSSASSSGKQRLAVVPSPTKQQQALAVANRRDKTQAIVPVGGSLASFGVRQFTPQRYEEHEKMTRKRKPEATMDDYITNLYNARNVINKSDNRHFLTNGRSLLSASNSEGKMYHIYPLSRLQVGTLMKLFEIYAPQLQSGMIQLDVMEHMVLEKVRMMQMELSRTRVDLQSLGVKMGINEQIDINMKKLEELYGAVWQNRTKDPWEINLKKLHDQFRKIKIFIDDTDKNKLKTLASKATKFYNGYKGTYFKQLFVGTALDRISLLRVTMHNSTRGQAGTDCTDLIELLMTMSREERERVSLPTLPPEDEQLDDDEDEQQYFDMPYKGDSYYDEVREANFCGQLALESQLHYNGDKVAGYGLSRFGIKSPKFNAFGYWIIHMCRNQRSERFDRYHDEMADWVTELEDFLSDFNFTYKIMELFTEYSYSRLRSIFDDYLNKKGKNVYSIINAKWNEVRKKKVRNSFDHYIQLVNSIVEDVYMGRPYFFARLLAEKFEKLLDKDTTNDQDAFNDITRILLHRGPVDLVEVNDEYLRMLGKIPNDKNLSDGILKKLEEIIKHFSKKGGSKDRGGDEVETAKGYRAIMEWVLMNPSKMRKYVGDEYEIDLGIDETEEDTAAFEQNYTWQEEFVYNGDDYEQYNQHIAEQMMRDNEVYYDAVQYADQPGSTLLPYHPHHQQRQQQFLPGSPQGYSNQMEPQQFYQDQASPAGPYYPNPQQQQIQYDYGQAPYQGGQQGHHYLEHHSPGGGRRGGRRNYQ